MKNILWGAATAAYQVEGATYDDGKGKNSWDQFYELNNLGYDGRFAVDHYHHMKEDVKLFSEIGLESYRFSISWSRIFPEGRGKINEKGLQFYRDLVDELLKYDIEPYVTLYHWDLPLPLLEEGGWFNPETIEAFLAYCQVLFETFKGRVKLWATINEPASEVIEGYVQGTHPPQHKNEYGEALQVSHHYNVASAKAIRLFREMKMDGKIGIVLNPMPVDVLEETEDALKARQIAYDYLSDWYISPALTGTYPSAMLAYCQKNYQSPKITSEDIEVMKDNCGDFLGINYYMRRVVAAGDLDHPYLEKQFKFVKVPGGHYTKWDWEIYPQGLSDLIQGIYAQYGPCEIIISENGMGFDDPITATGEFIDEQRQSYLKEHTNVVRDLIGQGCQITGYYVWSALDLLSWTNGYQKRYGLIGVDFNTMKRTIKQSGYWYKDFIETMRKYE
ncbi:glycoside hydrolase family 1 protein [Allofustis seminis]|uniref:glycoside hydrolase family 1 protein n=1 Tax=Allofustis seminis TaxID=166939 RepID=UPI000381C3F0|nr:family 1 glycosylhydrolase [Allofustis seminis]